MVIGEVITVLDTVQMQNNTIHSSKAHNFKSILKKKAESFDKLLNRELLSDILLYNLIIQNKFV